MVNPRKWMLQQFSAIFQLLQNILIPVGTTGMLFRRYKLEVDGWIWFVFPRFAIKQIEEVDLSELPSQTILAVQPALDEIASLSQREIHTAVERSAVQRADNARVDFLAKMETIVSGSDELPSALLSKGRAVVQSVHRSIVEDAGIVSANHFEEVTRRMLAQMLIYAREEAGDMPQVRTALPVGTRFVYYGDRYALYIIEELPRVRTILWDGEEVTLSFPYVIFPIYLRNGKFEAMQVFFRNEPLKSASDILCVVPMPDVMGYSERLGPEKDGPKCKYVVCFPGPRISKGTPAEIAYSAQEVFWCSNFNSRDWQDDLQDLADTMEDFSTEDWEGFSENNPIQALRTHWLETKYTPEVLGKRLKKGKNDFNPQKSMTRLEEYLHDLGDRLSVSTQEVVVNAIEDSNALATARALFDAGLKEVLQEEHLADRMGELVRSELESACSEAQIGAVIEEVAHKASAKIADVITPTMQIVAVQVAQHLRGT
jgi:hypothetical protein